VFTFRLVNRDPMIHCPRRRPVRHRRRCRL